MDQKTLQAKTFKTLEFHKITDRLAAKAISPMGKKMAHNLLPLNDRDAIIKRQKETSDASLMMLNKGSLPLGGIKDISMSLKRAKAGGVLSTTELLHLGDFLYVLQKLKKYRKDEGHILEYPYIDSFFEDIVLVNHLHKKITDTIENEQHIYDHASSKLESIRRQIKTKESAIQSQLQKIIHSSQDATMIQDAVITIRNGRYCVPIKQAYRSVFAGIIHDQSATGATLFMEPTAVVDLNNQVKSLEMEEEDEIYKILSLLTEAVFEESDTLAFNQAIIEMLDFIFARGALSVHMKATEPLFSIDGKIHIRQARHPLLDPQKVVPIDMWLGDDFSTLLITGPNTGGKTVSLKTLGLLSLMGQSGLHIPAANSSHLAVFDHVYADIGDEQSIEQSLSTFSSHMTNIIAILNHVTSNSLVLLDELGAGTDPTEGAALAIAIIEHLHEQGIHAAVTTHYSELKAYALSTDGIENAACEFDIETLQPTYKLLIGVPGKSNAFAISKKLGLPDFIIHMAKEALSQEEERFEDMISNLEDSQKKVLAEEVAVEALKLEAEKLRNKFEKQATRLEEREKKLLDDAKKEANFILQAAKDKADNIVKDMLAIGSKDMAKLEAHRMAIGDLAKQSNQVIQKTIKKTPSTTLETADIGDRVFVHSINQPGEVLTRPDNKGRLMVQAGIMKIHSNLSDLSPIDQPEATEKATYSKHNLSQKAMNINTELNLRGLMVEEALVLTDNYLDDAFLARLNLVSIIHGKGTGALREAVTSHLKNHPYVESFRLGEYGEGDSGITIVTLIKM